MLAIGSIDSWQTQVWDIASGFAQGPYEGYSVAWSPDSTRFVTEFRYVYDAGSGELLFHLDSPYYEGCQTYWSPDGSMIAITSCHDDDYLTIWSVEDTALLDTYWGGYSAAWSPDSTRIASDGQVREIATGLPVTIIPQMMGDIAWHPNGEWIASTGEYQVYIWDAVTGELLISWGFPDCSPGGFAWSSDGNRFAVNCQQTEPETKSDLIIWERVP
jgi:WD40 repeat protein